MEKKGGSRKNPAAQAKKPDNANQMKSPNGAGAKGAVPATEHKPVMTPKTRKVADASALKNQNAGAGHKPVKRKPAEPAGKPGLSSLETDVSRDNGTAAQEPLESAEGKAVQAAETDAAITAGKDGLETEKVFETDAKDESLGAEETEASAEETAVSEEGEPPKEAEAPEKTEAARETERSGQKAAQEETEAEALAKEEKTGADITQSDTTETDNAENPGAEPESRTEQAEGGESEEKAKRSRKRSKMSKNVSRGIAVAAAVLVAGGIGGYAYGANYYKAKFFPNTTINGIDASGKTVAEVEDLIASGIDGYKLTLKERYDKEEEIFGDDIDLKSEFDGSLEKILSSQKPMEWIRYQWTPTNHEIETMVVYDQDSLDQVLKKLECMDKRKMKKAGDAKVSDFIEDTGFTVLPPEPGTVLKEKEFKAGVGNAIMNLQTELVLEDIDCYEGAQIDQDDPTLNTLVENLNKYAKVEITYQFGDQQEVLDGTEIQKWLNHNEDLTVELNREGIAEYVKTLAEKWDTSGKPKNFKTTGGDKVTIKRGAYGWKIDQKKEAEEIYNNILAGENVAREPIYAQTAASRGETDYGDTYVEINLTGQHLYFYKGGKLVIETDFVSGNLSRGWGTPAGAYSLAYKQRDAVLRGPGYASPVKYWMPFNGGIGLHDASWRSTFGGNIYKNGGSHGCVNLPRSAAKTIFDNIDSGTPVLCYTLDGSDPVNRSPSGSGTKTTKPAATPAPTPAPAPVPAETAPPAQTAPPETQAPQTEAPKGPGYVQTAPDGQNAGPGATQAPETQAPAPETQAPAPETAAPAPETPAPAPETPAPAPEAPAPAPEAPAPEVPQVTPG